MDITHTPTVITVPGCGARVTGVMVDGIMVTGVIGGIADSTFLGQLHLKCAKGRAISVKRKGRAISGPALSSYAISHFISNLGLANRMSRIFESFAVPV